MDVPRTKTQTPPVNERQALWQINNTLGEIVDQLKELNSEVHRINTKKKDAR